MREELFRLVNKAKRGDTWSRIYDLFIMAVSVISVVPLAFRTIPEEFAGALSLMEILCVYILFLDYILHWMTYDYKTGKKGAAVFVLYPFTPMAVIDMAALLPSLGLIPASFKILRLLRLVKLVAYSRSCTHIVNVFKKERKTLGSVLVIAVAYIFISALIMFQHEPATTFPTFFDALYWATIALTTIGYGDLYPHTDIGKLISMISALFGVAVIAMPAGIVTAGFVEELQEDTGKKKGRKKDRSREEEAEDGQE